MCDFEEAWCGGFFEGEGCIRIERNGPNREYFTARLRATQKYRDPLERLQETLNGNIYGGPGRWQWVSSGLESTATALEILRPWLVIKQPQADLVLDFIRLKRQYARHDRYQGMHDKCSELKH